MGRPNRGIKGRGYRIDLVGERFGRLVVTAFDHATEKNQAMWMCQCDCGNRHVAMGNRLKRGKTQSCGCLQAEQTRTRSVTHGLSKSAEYRIYKGMLNRCYNENVRAYARYGGRGIGVCERWRFGEGPLSGFECFFKDMGRRPAHDYSLERKEVDGNYEPDNVVWADAITQANNTSRNHFIDVGGETLTIAEACRKYGTPYSRTLDRIANGWDCEAAVLAGTRETERDFFRRTCDAIDDAVYVSPWARQRRGLSLYELERQATDMRERIAPGEWHIAFDDPRITVAA